MLWGEGAYSFFYSSPLCLLSLHSFITQYVSTQAQGIVCLKTLQWLCWLRQSQTPHPPLLKFCCLLHGVSTAVSGYLVNWVSKLVQFTVLLPKCLCWCCVRDCWSHFELSHRGLHRPFGREGRRKAFPRSFSAGQGTVGMGSRDGDPAYRCGVLALAPTPPYWPAKTISALILISLGASAVCFSFKCFKCQTCDTVKYHKVRLDKGK